MDIEFDKLKDGIRNNEYQFLGAGSGRNVYDLDNGYVAKVAKNRRGIVQNKAEYQIATENHSHIFAKVKEVSEDNVILIMEKAEKINSMAEVWAFFKVRNNKELFAIEEFRNLLRKNNLLPADLRRRNSWGMIKGKPVIIDFGFTREVRRFYTLF